MYSRGERFVRSRECNFCVYFPGCTATREIDPKMTWAHSHTKCYQFYMVSVYPNGHSHTKCYQCNMVSVHANGQSHTKCYQCNMVSVHPNGQSHTKCCQCNMLSVHPNAYSHTKSSNAVWRRYTQAIIHTLNPTKGPFYWHGIILIPAWISNYIHYKVWVKLLLHSRTSTVQPWKLGTDKKYQPTICDY